MGGAGAAGTGRTSLLRTSLTTAAAPLRVEASTPATAATAAVPPSASRKRRRAGPASLAVASAGATAGASCGAGSTGGVSGGPDATAGRRPASGCHSNSFRMSHRNSAIPTSATSTGTGMALAVRSARLSTATSPTAPNTAMRITPAKRRRTSRTPESAASAAMTSAMPPSSATLSAVPNKEMAHSLTPGGTVSITAPPTAVTGDTVGLTRLAVSSPRTTAVPTATSPAPAAHRSRDCRCRTPGSVCCCSLPASVPPVSFPCPSKLDAAAHCAHPVRSFSSTASRGILLCVPCGCLLPGLLLPRQQAPAAEVAVAATRLSGRRLPGRGAAARTGIRRRRSPR